MKAQLGLYLIAIGQWLVRLGKKMLPPIIRIETAKGDELSRIGMTFNVPREFDDEYRARVNAVVKGNP